MAREQQQQFLRHAPWDVRAEIDAWLVLDEIGTNGLARLGTSERTLAHRADV